MKRTNGANRALLEQTISYLLLPVLPLFELANVWVLQVSKFLGQTSVAHEFELQELLPLLEGRHLGY